MPILEDDGYEVRSAYDGDEAVALARQLQPDLVITDVEMPKLDGYGVCKALKDDPALAHVPVLICSSLGEATDLERGFDAGADDYLVKPVIPEELSTRVRALVLGSLPASRERVLVVDDSPAQRHYVADCLARQGFVVITAENGKIALDKAQALRPALVVSDYEMPVMTGFELVHALRRDPELRQTPVIMLTARDSKRDMAQMRAAGASAYLVKPFSQDKCLALVERTLAERRLLAYKEASSLFISEGARHAAEERALRGETLEFRADERNVSIMFSDLVGFTPMSASLTPARADQAAQRLLRRDVPDRQAARRRHRQVHRRRDHGDLRRRPRPAPAGRAGGARRARHAGRDARLQRGPPDHPGACGSASTPARSCAATSARASSAATTP